MSDVISQRVVSHRIPVAVRYIGLRRVTNVLHPPYTSTVPASVATGHAEQCLLAPRPALGHADRPPPDGCV